MKPMKFILNRGKKGVRVPNAALKLSGFGPVEQGELHPLSDALVILKRTMTVPELARAAGQLQDLSARLSVHIARACGPCDSCGACSLDLSELTDLPGIPAETVGMMAAAKVCLANLVELAKEDEVVYG